jgi:carotenoid cleavage dioxygenase
MSLIITEKHGSCPQVYIIDAKRFSDEPIAKITLPQRVPYGFHGNYFYKK